MAKAYNLRSDEVNHKIESSGNHRAFKRFTLNDKRVDNNDTVARKGQECTDSQCNAEVKKVDYEIEIKQLRDTNDRLKSENEKQRLRSEVALLKAQNENKDLKFENMTLQDEKMKLENENIALKEKLSKLEEKMLKIEKENVTLIEKLNKVQSEEKSFFDDNTSSNLVLPKNGVKEESQRKVWFFNDCRFESEENEPRKVTSLKEELDYRQINLVDLITAGSYMVLETPKWPKCSGYAFWHANILHGLKCCDNPVFSRIMNKSRDILIIKILNKWTFPFRKPIIDLRRYLDDNAVIVEWQAKNLNLKRLLHPHDNTIHNDLVQIDEYRWNPPFLVDEKQFLVFFMKF